jgi:aminopeptidase N
MRRSRGPGGFLIALLGLAILAPGAAAQAPAPGARGIGDRLYPLLGNGGYDVSNYRLELRYATSAPSQPLAGVATIRARATQALSRFDLDFGGDAVASVRVNRQPAAWRRDGEELVITPRRPIAKNRAFTVRVAGFTAHPTAPNPADPRTTAFFTTPDGSATAPQPIFAHDIFPSNDHPRDKATFTFVLDVPAGETAVANGDLVSVRRGGGRAVWTYRESSPMATELTQIAVGRFDIVHRGRRAGVAIRDVLAPALTGLRDDITAEDGHLAWLQRRLGAYPFHSYGTFVVDADLGFALETQTISLFDRPWFTDFGRAVWDPVMLHELTHQWFGDSVAPYEWSDLWLNEGHASWYEFAWAAEHGWLGDDTNTGIESLTDYMRSLYAQGDQYRAQYGPVARPSHSDVFTLFSDNVYGGGALVLYALRQKVGAATFARIERAWVHVYRDRSASTADFIALASRASGRDLRSFLGAWLYGTKTPPMPGHPDWTVDAPTAAPALESLGVPARPAAADGRRR